MAASAAWSWSGSKATTCAILTSPDALDLLRTEVSEERWQYLNEVVVTAGPNQSRLKAGIALAVIRDCLAGFRRCTGPISCMAI